MKNKKTIRPTNDSERSPAVHYANWKETIFLTKKLATIGKTERGIVHRITVDQKVKFRRFQNMLSRTKLAQARAANDKQLIQELQGRDMRKLHCESHLVNQGGDDTFLGKLEKNPCNFDSAAAAAAAAAAATNVNRKLSGAQRKYSNAKQKVTDQEMLSLIQNVIENDDIEHTSSNLRRLSALGHILDAAKSFPEGKADADNKDENDNDLANSNNVLSQRNTAVNTTFKERPITTSNARKQQSFGGNGNDGRNNNKNNNIGSKSLSDVVSGTIQLKEISCENINDQNQQNKTSNQVPLYKQNNEKDTASLSSSEISNSIEKNRINDQEEYEVDNVKFRSDIKILNTNNGVNKININNNSKLLKNRANAKVSLISNSSVASPHRKTATSIFEEIKRPDVRGLRLQEAKSVDYKDQVRDFVEGLATLGQGVPDFDYYASKMQADAALQVKTVLPLQMPATPDEIYRKHTGDTTISCITLPKLKTRKGEDSTQHDNDEMFVFSMDYLSLNASESSFSDVSNEDEGE